MFPFFPPFFPCFSFRFLRNFPFSSVSSIYFLFFSFLFPFFPFHFFRFCCFFPVPIFFLFSSFFPFPSVFSVFFLFFCFLPLCFVFFRFTFRQTGRHRSRDPFFKTPIRHIVSLLQGTLQRRSSTNAPAKVVFESVVPRADVTKRSAGEKRACTTTVAPLLSRSVAQPRGHRTKNAMVYTIFLGKQRKRVYTIGPERGVYTIEPQTLKKKKGGFPRWCILCLPCKRGVMYSCEC